MSEARGISDGTISQSPSVPRRVLVTGGADILCARLVAAGHEVLCVDNFYSSRRENITDLLPHPSFELLRRDVAFPLQDDLSGVLLAEVTVAIS